MQEDVNVQNDTTRPTMYVPEMRALQIVESIKTYQKGKGKKEPSTILKQPLSNKCNSGYVAHVL